MADIKYVQKRIFGRAKNCGVNNFLNLGKIYFQELTLSWSIFFWMDSMVLVAASLALDDILVAEDGFQRPEENLKQKEIIK